MRKYKVFIASDGELSLMYRGVSFCIYEMVNPLDDCDGNKRTSDLFCLVCHMFGDNDITDYKVVSYGAGASIIASKGKEYGWLDDADLCINLDNWIDSNMDWLKSFSLNPEQTKTVVVWVVWLDYAEGGVHQMMLQMPVGWQTDDVEKILVDPDGLNLSLDQISWMASDKYGPYEIDEIDLEDC